jgi:hypothetical protein
MAQYGPKRWVNTTSLAFRAQGQAAEKSLQAKLIDANGKKLACREFWRTGCLWLAAAKFFYFYKTDFTLNPTLFLNHIDLVCKFRTLLG